MKTNKAFVSIVGAGPGDPELISVKGLKRIERADVILYDALVGKELLDYAKPEAKLIYVGKRSGQHSYRQEEINKLIVAHAVEGNHVLRLKGGDPFVFGRGHEELVYVKSFDIKVEVIPGISSATGLTALAGVPLTKRGLNESFWVITGTNSCRLCSEDIKLVAQSNATAVILMGLNRLPEIIQSYIQEERYDMPAMIIQDGSLPTQKIVKGFVHNITDIAKAEGIQSPAIIVIGKAIALAHDDDQLVKQIMDRSLVEQMI